MHTPDMLPAQQQELDMLLRSLSHDLRTPAMTMLGFADLLVEQLSPAAKQDSTGQYLQHIRSSAQRQLTVIEKLLEYMQWSHHPMQVESLDLGLLCQQTWQQFPEAVRQHVAFAVSPTPATPGDRSLLGIVLHALLDNAVKFTRHVAAPQIALQVQQQDGVNWFVLTDNGIGFHPDQATRLFKPFQKLHAGKQYEGAGMGLYLAARLIERHHGRIEAHAQPNMGTTIRFCLNKALNE